ncbi:MAG: hypothetical protein AB1757_30495 [Acidobacteriota bacterium]
MNHKKTFQQLPTVFLLVTLIVSGFSSACTGSPPPQDIVVYSEVTLTDQWLEITLKEPLRVEKRKSEIVIWFAEGTNYCVVLTENKIRLPDGSFVFPTGQIIDQDDKVFELELAGFGNSFMTLGSKEINRNPDFPKDQLFTKVRLKASKPLQCQKIAWRNYNPWDEK